MVAVCGQLSLSLGDELLNEPMGGTWLFTAVEPSRPALLFSALSTMLGLMLGAGVVHFSARFLGGKGAYTALLSAQGFATAPSLLFAPLYLVGSIFGTGFGLMVLTILILWSLILNVVAVREVHQFSTGRAVGALILPGALLFLVVFLFVFYFLFSGV